LSPDASWAWVVDEQQLQLWDLQRGCVVREQPRPAQVVAVVAGRGVFAVFDDARVRWLQQVAITVAPWMLVRPRSGEQLALDATCFAAAIDQAEVALQQGNLAHAIVAIDEARTTPGYERSEAVEDVRRRLAACTARGVATSAYVRRSLSTLGWKRVCVDAGGERAFALDQSGKLVAWRLGASCQPDDDFHEPNPLTDLQLSRDGSVLLVVTTGHTLRLWDTRTRSVMTIALEAAVERMALSTTGDRVLLQAGGVWLLDLASEGEQRVAVELPPAITAMALSGDCLVVGHADGSVRFQHLTTGTKWQTRAHASAVSQLALDGAVGLSGDGRSWHSFATRDGSLLAKHAQPSVRLGMAGGGLGWVVPSSGLATTVDREIVAHELEMANDMALSADGMVAVTASDDGLRLWRLHFARIVDAATA